MRSVSQLNGSSLNASDGEIGTVKQAYIDDEAWTIRYLVVDTGRWLSGREVSVLPSAVEQPFGSAKLIEVSLTRAQVANSPPVDTHKPVSRQHEREHLDHYGSSIYWDRPGWMALGVHPMAPIFAASEFERDRSES